jgi:hypothetical protein
MQHIVFKVIAIIKECGESKLTSGWEACFFGQTIFVTVF